MNITIYLSCQGAAKDLDLEFDHDPTFQEVDQAVRTWATDHQFGAKYGYRWKYRQWVGKGEPLMKDEGVSKPAERTYTQSEVIQIAMQAWEAAEKYWWEICARDKQTGESAVAPNKTLYFNDKFNHDI